MRESRIAGSQRLGITDWWTATDLDNAISLRLLKYDNERRVNDMENSAKLIAYEVSKMFGDGNGDDGADGYDGSVVVL